MILPKTYQSRLVIYSILLISFLTGTLLYTYHSTRDFALQESNAYVKAAANMHNHHLQRDIDELIHHNKLIANDLRLQEYINLANLNGDTGPLTRLLKQTFSWLADERVIVLARNGQTLIGSEHRTLAYEVSNHAPWLNSTQTFYLTDNNLELVNIEPVSYRGNIIGAIALTHPTKRNWQDWQKEHEGSAAFVVHNGKITNSTLSHMIELPFNRSQDHASLNGETFRIHPIDLVYTNAALPTLWYGISETKLLNTLVQQGKQTLLLVVIGMTAIFLVGLAIIRSFNKPLASLMQLTSQVGKGDLPDVKHTQIRTEIDVLGNNFADMVHSLKEKQAQIDEAHRELQKSAITDTLTGLYNRRHLQDLYPKLQAQVQRDGSILTAIICDLDYFKQLNDKFGHLTGDRALVDFTNIMTAQSRNNDFIYRMGGEEFLILSITDDIEGGIILAEKIRAATREHVMIEQGQSISMTVSCGISHTRPNENPDTSLNQLLSRTDKALYQAKQRGRNQVRTYESMEEEEKASAPTTYNNKVSAIL